MSEFLFSCADYKINKSTDSIERNYFSSLGFALIYNDSLYQQKIINKSDFFIRKISKSVCRLQSNGRIIEKYAYYTNNYIK